MKKTLNLFLVFLIVLSVIALVIFWFRNTNSNTPQEVQNSNKKTLKLKNKDQEIEFEIDIADTDEERAKGLMFRKEMGDREGMLFIFEKEEQRSFWMKDTFIPLDMIFFDSNMKYVSVQKNAEPCLNKGYSCPSYSSTKPAKYVLEVKSGSLNEELYTEDLIFEIQ